MTIHVHGFATHSATSELVPFAFERRELVPRTCRSTSFLRNLPLRHPYGPE